MRYLKYLFLAVLGAILVAIAVANREVVTLRLVTDDTAAFLGLPYRIELPLFVVIFAALVAGILVGLVWEWFREYQYRAEASRKRRDAESLKRDLGKLRGASSDAATDDVLALLDGQR